MGANSPLQGGIALDQEFGAIDQAAMDPAFWSSSMTDLDRLTVLDTLAPTFASLDDNTRQQVFDGIRQQFNPDLGQQASNIFQGLGAGIGQVAADPLALLQALGSQAGQAVQTEFQNRATPPQSPEDAVGRFIGQQLAVPAGFVGAVRDFGLGLYNLPGDINNLRYGRQVSRPAQFQLPLVDDIRAQYPVSGFIGGALPYAIAPELAASRLPLAGNAARAAGILGDAAAGAIADPGGLDPTQRLAGRVMGGLADAGLGLGGIGAAAALGRLSSFSSSLRPDQPISLARMRAESEPLQAGISVEAPPPAAEVSLRPREDAAVDLMRAQLQAITESAGSSIAERMRNPVVQLQTQIAGTELNQLADAVRQGLIRASDKDVVQLAKLLREIQRAASTGLMKKNTLAQARVLAQRLKAGSAGQAPATAPPPAPEVPVTNDGGLPNAAIQSGPVRGERPEGTSAGTVPQEGGRPGVLRPDAPAGGTGSAGQAPAPSSLDTLERPPRPAVANQLPSEPRARLEAIAQKAGFTDIDSVRQVVLQKRAMPLKKDYLPENIPPSNEELSNALLAYAEALETTGLSERQQRDLAGKIASQVKTLRKPNVTPEQRFRAEKLYADLEWHQLQSKIKSYKNIPSEYVDIFETNFDEETGLGQQLEVSNKQLTFEQVQQALRGYHSTYRGWAEKIAEAIKAGQRVSFGYNGEIVGRSSRAGIQERFSPTNFAVTANNKVLLQGYNENGHFTTLHLNEGRKAGGGEPSRITSEPVAVEEPAFRGPRPNVYEGSSPYNAYDATPYERTAPIKDSELRQISRQAQSSLDSVLRQGEASKLPSGMLAAMNRVAKGKGTQVADFQRIKQYLKEGNILSVVCNMLGLKK